MTLQNGRKPPSSRAERLTNRDQLGRPITFQNKVSTLQSQAPLSPKRHFAAIPLRAISDKRLSSLEVRVLAAISYHDRMSKLRGRGAGCWAGNKRLATLCGCRPDSFSAAATQLLMLGYITREQNPFNKKTRIYRVIFETGDRADAQPLAENTRAIAQTSLGPGITNSHEEPPTELDPNEIVGQGNSQHSDVVEEISGEYITLKRKINDAGLDEDAARARRFPIFVGEVASRASTKNPRASLDLIECALKDGGSFDAGTELAVRSILDDSEVGSEVQDMALRILLRSGNQCVR
jgi:DNA-binding MarR family transcriptional regulator